MIIIHGINAPVGTSREEIAAIAAKRLGVDPKGAHIHKISLDARKRSDIKLAASVCFELDADTEKRLAARSDCIYTDGKPFVPSVGGKLVPEGRIAVAGFGPAGMFAALILAEAGYAPLVIERGGDVDSRERAVESYRSGGVLDERSNVQFGEGGAGMFSDGKLTTRIKDPMCRYVTKRFVEFGAPEEILTAAHPHIGTDNLKGIVRRIRERIVSLGGEVRSNSLLDDLIVKGGDLRGISVNGCTIPVSALICAIGHSARDTYEMLLANDVELTAKAFAVGARIEHLQERVDRSLYGDIHDPLLPIGEYQLSYTQGGRGVYTFCMCPGGVVMASASSKGEIVTNGMSVYARDGKNANSALIVSVSPDDFGHAPLDGVKFARGIERRAYELGGRTNF